MGGQRHPLKQMVLSLRGLSAAKRLWAEETGEETQTGAPGEEMPPLDHLWTRRQVDAGLTEGRSQARGPRGGVETSKVVQSHQEAWPMEPQVPGPTARTLWAFPPRCWTCHPACLCPKLPRPAVPKPLGRQAGRHRAPARALGGCFSKAALALSVRVPGVPRLVPMPGTDSRLLISYSQGCHSY